MENALTLHQPDLTLRTITGPDELDLFNTLPYVLNDEVGGDLAVGRRRPEWLWLALRGDRVVARAGWWSRAGDQPPLLMDIFDIDGDADDGVRLLKTALPAVVPAGATPPQYARFPHGGGLRPGRLRHLRAPDRHDLATMSDSHP